MSPRRQRSAHTNATTRSIKPASHHAAARRGPPSSKHALHSAACEHTPPPPRESGQPCSSGGHRLRPPRPSARTSACGAPAWPSAQTSQTGPSPARLYQGARRAHAAGSRIDHHAQRLPMHSARRAPSAAGHRPEGARAHQHRVGPRAQMVHPQTALLAGDPLGIPGLGGHPAVDSHGVLVGHKRQARRSRACGTRRSAGWRARQDLPRPPPPPCRPLAGARSPVRSPGPTGPRPRPPPASTPARRRASVQGGVRPVVAAGLERDVDGGSRQCGRSKSWHPPQPSCDDLGVVPPGRRVEPLPHHSALDHDDRPHYRVGAGQAPAALGQGQRPFQEVSVVLGQRQRKTPSADGPGVGGTRARRAAFSLPDSHCRPRNRTWSAPREARGLSPPVGNLTRPRRPECISQAVEK